MWRTHFLKRIMAPAKDFWSWIIRPWSDRRWVVLVFFEIGISILVLARFWDRFLQNPVLGETLRNAGLLVVAVVATTLAVWRSKVGERQVRLAERRLFEERHQKGTEMLGHALLSVRLGGIYALKHLAQEEPKQFHLRTIRQFCAFVLHPPDNKDEDSLVKGSSQEAFNSQTLREDFQAIMEAIRTRSTACIETEREQGFRLRLPSADLAGAKLAHANLLGANLEGANLAGANLEGANLAGTYLTNALLPGANLAEADLPGANLAGANLAEADLVGADLSRADLKGANLAEADLVGADLSRADLKGANLAEADLVGADLSRADLKGANLADASLLGANLAGANLEGARLAGANLAHARLQFANLEGADLSRADLKGATLPRANLEAANLAGATLQGTNLRIANLKGANLLGTELNKADLGGANFDGDSRLTQTQLDRATGDPLLGPPKLENAIDHGSGKPLHWERLALRNSRTPASRVDGDAVQPGPGGGQGPRGRA